MIKKACKSLRFKGTHFPPHVPGRYNRHGMRLVRVTAIILHAALFPAIDSTARSIEANRFSVYAVYTVHSIHTRFQFSDVTRFPIFIRCGFIRVSYPAILHEYFLTPTALMTNVMCFPHSRQTIDFRFFVIEYPAIEFLAEHRGHNMQKSLFGGSVGTSSFPLPVFSTEFTPCRIRPQRPDILQGTPVRSVP